MSYPDEKLVNNEKSYIIEATSSDDTVLSAKSTERSIPAGDNGPSIDLYPDPTPDELETLRRVRDKIPFSAFIVAVVELCERFTYYGVSGPFQNYIQYNPSDLIPGKLGKGESTATALNYFYQFWTYCTPIFGAILGDQYLGKFWAIITCCCIYMVGLIVLLVTSFPFADTSASLAGLIIGMICTGFGAGGIKANVGPLIAEQYTNKRLFVKTLKSGERVLVDPRITNEVIFQIFYLCINIGALSPLVTTNLELHVSYWAAFLVPTCFFCLAFLAMFLGKRILRIKKPQGSVIPMAFRVCFQAIKHKFSMEAVKPSRDPDANYPWNDHFVEEIKRALQACKVFCLLPIYSLMYGNMSSNFVSQAGQMELHGIPNDVMSVFDSLTIIVFVPFMSAIGFPLLRKMGFKMMPVTKMTIGYFLIGISMAYAAIIQHLIYSAGPCYENPLQCPASNNGTLPNRVNVAIQIPAYIIMGMSEIFNYVTGLEYAYTKAPDSLKSFVMALYLLTNAVGAALGMAISPVAVNPKILWMYTGLAVAAVVAGIVFWFMFRHLNSKEDAMNHIDAEAEEYYEAAAFIGEEGRA
ncbi:hypothetical protein CANCADRAFT_32746 [Tortispora caseinolytica NRRL Y-17796]|uniref:Major facilitator superfamily (MFS) profile domain-containing protein n=1 Tax=Tortispora caseinolytica NRRL Y-17796 TaxID=767744 RepID=A0A1E4TCM1_9ASCO|nr:hypothetical protein CANCADRAFT_32746 [Tortispora caseinolytica NRRL Y-17796]